MRMRTTWAAATAILLCVTPLAAGPAGAAGQPLQSASPGDPYANCRIGASGTGVNAPSAEVEPYVAVDPRHPDHTITVFQQDRWSNGGARGLMSSSTTDGVHFTETPLPFSACAPGGAKYERGSDAWVSYGPDGVAYASGLSFDANGPRNGVTAASTYDNGRTWQDLRSVIADNDATITNDKNSVTADPRRPGTAYQVWDRIDQVATGPNAHYNGPAYLAITHDHGKTWSPARPFVDTGAIPNSQTIGNVIVADARTGTLYDFFEWQTYSDATGTQATDLHYAVVSSTDQGEHWTKPVTVAVDTGILEVHPNAPTDPSKALRGGSGLPSPAIDPETGELYVAYEGTDFTGGAYDAIQLTHSTDGGRTWSGPTRINQAPNAPAFTPSIAVDRHGTVAVGYYDVRYLTPTDTTTLPTAAWLVTFPRGGEEFPAERRISAVFDWEAAPYAGWGHFLGDYEGMTLAGDRFRPVLVEANSLAPLDSTDVWTGTFKPVVIQGAAAPQHALTAAAAPNRAASLAAAHRLQR
ncbi:sialidase family protein [Embleya sp. AB8]|uniref:sialidase family protein n=1 Tax=Embleya sp. AB8 TaxID=3156304 RepID=UPI003C7680E0